MHAHTVSGSNSNFVPGILSSMASCEPRRSSAYSEDVRWRIIWQSQALSLSSKEIAIHLNIDILTVKRILHIFTTTGDVCKRTYSSERRYRKKVSQCNITYLILTRPGIYLREIVSELSTVLGLDITENAVCKVIKKIGCTHHKLATYALQRDDTLHQQYVLDVAIYPRETLLFVGEMGTDR